jgi:hypothetical protein
MSTNYYAIRKKDKESIELINDYWGHIEESVKQRNIDDMVAYSSKLSSLHDSFRTHMGHAAAGWKFTFNHNRWKFYTPYRESIDKFLKECEYIEDEYNRRLSVSDFWNVVDSHSKGMNCEEHCLYDIENGIKKDSGEIDDKYDLLLTESKARQIYADYKLHDFYEVHKFEGNSIDELPYRFFVFDTFS